MKNLLLILFLPLFLTGCFENKKEDIAEKNIMNCASSTISKRSKEEFEKKFLIWRAFNLELAPNNVFEEKIKILKKAGFSKKEIIRWAISLKTVDIDDTNREVINYFTKIENDYNNLIDKVIDAKNLTSNLQNEEYENIFKWCERDRNEAPKTFDAKWKEAVIERPKFR